MSDQTAAQRPSHGSGTQGITAKPSTRSASPSTTQRDRRPLPPVEKVVEDVSSMGNIGCIGHLFLDMEQRFPESNVGREELRAQIGTPLDTSRFIDRVRSYGHISSENYLTLLKMTEDAGKAIRNVGLEAASRENYIALCKVLVSASYNLPEGYHELVFLLQVCGDHWKTLRTIDGIIGELRDEAISRFETADPVMRNSLRTAFMLPQEARLFQAMPDTVQVFSHGRYPDVYANRLFGFEECQALADARKIASPAAVISGHVAKSELVGVKATPNGYEAVLAGVFPNRWRVQHLSGQTGTPSVADMRASLEKSAAASAGIQPPVPAPVKFTPNNTSISRN